MKLYQEFLMGQDDLVEKEINVAGAVIIKNNDEGTQSVLLIQRSKKAMANVGVCPNVIKVIKIN